jgi:hypothetical protein
MLVGSSIHRELKLGYSETETALCNQNSGFT